MPLAALLIVLAFPAPAAPSPDPVLDRVDALEAEFWENFAEMEQVLAEARRAGGGEDLEAAAAVRGPAVERFMALKKRGTELREEHRTLARTLQPMILMPETPEPIRERLRAQELAINRMRSRKEDLVMAFDEEQGSFLRRLGEDRRVRRYRRAAAAGAGLVLLAAALGAAWEAWRRRVRVETVFDAALGRHVDVLRLPGGAEDLERARLAAQLEHPGILRLHSAERSGRGLALVFEHCEGRPLAESPKLAWKDLQRVGRAACAALEHAHARGVAHGGLDGRSILLAPDGGVKLTGFGARRGTPEEDLRALAACLKAAAGELPPGAASLFSDTHHTAASFAAAIMKA